MKNVLIFPAGSEIAHEIYNALKYSKFVKLFGGTSVNDHSEYIFENLITGFPFITEHNFIEFLNGVIKEYKIDCVYPAHDSVCCMLSQYREKIDAQIIITDNNTTQICRSKKKTYDFFKDEKFVPEYFERIEKINRYPVFVKPEIGQGSYGAKKIENESELYIEINKNPFLLICEYLAGDEFTIDCFTDRTGKLRVVNMRTRERVRAGISVKSKKIELDDDVKYIAETINNRLAFRGAWFLQLKKNDKEEYKLLEISPRIPGTMGLSRNMGVNFPLLTLFDYWNMDVDINMANYNIEVDRALHSAYKIAIEYTHIYIDYDDTLIINGKVNGFLLLFLYQSADNGKKIHLISKHRGDLIKDLQQYKISVNLFDEVQVLLPDEEKSNYIKEFPAIFIDDSFAERKKVTDVFNIPVFDVDMIESLIDWRM